MPDHIHTVFKIEDNQTLSQVMMSFKGFIGKKIKELFSKIEPNKTLPKIWQSQYYDHLIRKNENYIEIMNYCLYNPVRKEIVNEPQEYPYWWCKYEILG